MFTHIICEKGTFNLLPTSYVKNGYQMSCIPITILLLFVGFSYTVSLFTKRAGAIYHKQQTIRSLLTQCSLNHYALCLGKSA